MYLIFIIFILVLGGISSAREKTQEDFQKIVIQIWNGPAPNSEAVKNIPRIGKEYISPTLTVFLPSAEKRNGASVLIIPGGGYMGCAIGYEGYDIAKWMVQRGITGCVLHYRRPIFRIKKEHIFKRVYDHKVPSDDAFRAMQVIRSKSKEWKLNSNMVGVMGFSAGGHLAATVGTHFDKGYPNAKNKFNKYSTMPNFMILVYPVIDMSDPAFMHIGSKSNLIGRNPTPKIANYYSCQKHIKPDTPPTFLLSTSDDYVNSENSIVMYQALKAKNISCELHIFEKGGHGYSMRPGKLVTKLWPTLLNAWLSNRGIINKKQTK